MFEIKTFSGKSYWDYQIYMVVLRGTDNSVNNTSYYYYREAACAASNIYRAIERRAEKALLG